MNGSAAAAAANGSASHAAASSNGATATAATPMHDHDDSQQQPRSKMARLDAECAHRHMDGPTSSPPSAASSYPPQLSYPPAHFGSDVANAIAAAPAPLPAFTFGAVPAPSVDRVNLKRTGPSLVAVHDQQRPSKRLHRTKLSQIGDSAATTGASSAAGSLLTPQTPASSQSLQESNRLLAQAHEERVQRRRRQQLHHLQLLAQSETVVPSGNHELSLHTPERVSRRGDSEMTQSGRADIRPLAGFVFRSSAHSPAPALTPTRSNSDNAVMASPCAASMHTRSPAPLAAIAAADTVAMQLQSHTRPSNRLPMSPLSRFHRSERSSALAGAHAASSFSAGALSGMDALPAHVPWWQQQQQQQQAPSEQPQRQTVIPSAFDRSAVSDGSWASTLLPSPPTVSTCFFALQRPTFETSPWDPSATNLSDGSSAAAGAARAFPHPQLQPSPSTSMPQCHSSGHMQD